MRRPPSALVLLGAILLGACTSEGDPTSEPSPSQPGAQVAVAMATSDHYVGAPQRISVGLILPDQRLVSFGSVDVTFSFVGTAEEPLDPQLGSSTVAVYLPTPGTADEPSGPAATLPSVARGVYQAEDVTFDRAGFWQIDVTVDVAGLGVQRGTTTFGVREDPAYPAPGEPALPTRNLTIRSKDAPLTAIDSRATTLDRVPDPELHTWTIARALEEGRPALVVFSTPVFCTSRFCGPVTDVVERFAARYEDRAVFVHVEIWRDYENQAINQAAADWLYRDGDLTEPWVFLIGADGTILDRWATLFREDEVAAELEALPRMTA